MDRRSAHDFALASFAILNASGEQVMFEANRRFFTKSFALAAGMLSASPPGSSAVVSTADRGAEKGKFIWPLVATMMLIALVEVLATELNLPPEQRAALFEVQSQAYP